MATPQSKVRIEPRLKDAITAYCADHRTSFSAATRIMWRRLLRESGYMKPRKLKSRHRTSTDR